MPYPTKKNEIIQVAFDFIGNKKSFKKVINTEKFCYKTQNGKI